MTRWRGRFVCVRCQSEWRVADWVLIFTNRPRTEGRNQLVLNLARDDVKASVYGFLDKLLSENDISFLKWEYNCN